MAAKISKGNRMRVLIRESKLRELRDGAQVNEVTLAELRADKRSGDDKHGQKNRAPNDPFNFAIGLLLGNLLFHEKKHCRKRPGLRGEFTGMRNQYSVANPALRMKNPAYSNPLAAAGAPIFGFAANQESKSGWLRTLKMPLIPACPTPQSWEH